MMEKTLINELEKQFEKAGFVASGELISDGDLVIPENTLCMHNSFGLMVGVEISEKGEELVGVINQYKENMHSLMRKALLFLENKKGLIVDGYLILIITGEPNENAKKLIREIELDTKVCRKHVVWPKEDRSELDKLQFITVLNLPEPLPSNSGSNVSFELSEKAKVLLDEYKRLGNLDGVLDSIKQGRLNDVN
ncbi:MAG: hypothetical protein COA96_01320 [SAR86 cluster bacterium]|uniref:Uncharacterized protein n=1 Tax=SAR86 cluster bacterium TaxID=2030880 RepID=A0A2A5B9D1_9GAMM|nr:MAG: hypothetical protein COA96_01320 [SAR86 cluster bacterium]